MKGKHLILDAKCNEKEKGKLIDYKLINNILMDLPKLVNMNRLTKPVIVNGSSNNPGLTGVVIIETSNIVLHTFLNSNKFSLDIFSVKEFGVEKVISYFKEHFNFKIIRKNLIERL